MELGVASANKICERNAMVEDKDLDAIVEQVSEFRHGSGLSEAGSVCESAEMESGRRRRKFVRNCACSRFTITVHLSDIPGGSATSGRWNTIYHAFPV